MIELEPWIVIVSLCVLFAETYMQDWKSVIIYLAVVSLCHYVLKAPMYLSFGAAGILACLMHLFSKKSSESFKGSGPKKSKKEDFTDEEDDEEGFEDDEAEDGEGDNFTIDKKSTVQEALKNFDPKTVAGMTADTRNLIRSQTELMKTIEELTPAIEKGMNLVDRMQGGKGKTKELFEKIEAMTKSNM